MVAREDSGQFEFDDRSNAALSLDPWSEDSATTKYTMAAFQGLQQHDHTSAAQAAWDDREDAPTPLVEASWSGESSWDEAPHVLEVSDIAVPASVPPPVPHRLPSNRTQPVPYGQFGLPSPSVPAPRVTLAPTLVPPRRLPSPPPQRLGSPRSSTLPGMRPQHAALETGQLTPSRPRDFRTHDGHDGLDEPNPFARPSFFSRTTVRAACAAVGLFGAALSADALFNHLPSGTRGLPGTVTPKALAAAVSGPISQPLSAPAPAELALAVQPGMAAQPGASSDSAEDKGVRPGASDDQLNAKERRAQKYKERREAAKARREEAKQARAEKAQARREAAEAKRNEARERREAASVARRESSSDTSSSSMLDNSPVDTSSSSGKVSSAGSGTLRINSRPWAEVWVDGRKIGTTPQLAISLAPGKHKVRLVNSQFEVSKNLDVNLRAGESVSRVELLDN